MRVMTVALLLHIEFMFHVNQLFADKLHLHIFIYYAVFRYINEIEIIKENGLL